MEGAVERASYIEMFHLLIGSRNLVSKNKQALKDRFYQEDNKIEHRFRQKGLLWPPPPAPDPTLIELFI